MFLSSSYLVYMLGIRQY